jgi:hypothetical protein
MVGVHEAHTCELLEETGPRDARNTAADTVGQFPKCARTNGSSKHNLGALRLGVVHLRLRLQRAVTVLLVLMLYSLAYAPKPTWADQPPERRIGSVRSDTKRGEDFFPLTPGLVWTYECPKCRKPLKWTVKTIDWENNSRQVVLAVQKNEAGNPAIDDVQVAIRLWRTEDSLVELRRGLYGQSRRVLLRFPLAAGTTWERQKHETCRVTALNQRARSPSGRYSDCVNIKCVVALGGDPPTHRTETWCRGIGLVRDDLGELSSFHRGCPPDVRADEVAIRDYWHRPLTAGELPERFRRLVDPSGGDRPVCANAALKKRLERDLQRFDATSPEARNLTASIRAVEELMKTLEALDEAQSLSQQD